MSTPTLARVRPNLRIFADAQVELVDAVAVERAGLDQVDGDVGALPARGRPSDGATTALARCSWPRDAPPLVGVPEPLTWRPGLLVNVTPTCTSIFGTM